MFNLISGALAPDAGHDRVSAASRSAGRQPFEIAQLGIGRTFQHVQLIAGMSVLDNVALGAYLRGSAGVARAALRLDRARKRALRAEAAAQIARVGLGRRAACARRLAAARAAAASSRSPARSRPIRCCCCSTSPRRACATAKSRSSRAAAQSARAEGMTILLVEHDMDFVMGLTDRLVVMDFGEKLAEGLPARYPAQSRRARSLPGGRLTRDGHERIARNRRPARRLRQGRGGARRLADGRARAASSR